jgi:hypothetical protein
MDKDGAPIAGVVLALSRTPLVDAYYDTDDSAGPVPEEAIFHCKSDANGQFLVRGLSHGKYDIRVIHRSYAWVDPNGEFARPGLVIPRPPAVFLMSRMMACYKRLVGSKILARRYIYNSGSSHWHWETVANLMVSQSKADESIVLALNNGAVQVTELHASIFVEDEGWREFRWPMVPFTVGDKPDIVELQAAPSDAGQSGSVRVELRNHRGELLEVDLQLVESPQSRFGVTIKNGVEQTVPCGSYFLHCAEAFVSRKLRKSILSVKRGTNEPFVVELDMVSCRWDLYLSSGRELVGMAMARITGSGQEEILRIASGGRTLLPRVPLQVEIMTELYHSRVTDFVVGADGATEEVLKCELR